MRHGEHNSSIGVDRFGFVRGGCCPVGFVLDRPVGVAVMVSTLLVFSILATAALFVLAYRDDMDRHKTSVNLLAAAVTVSGWWAFAWVISMALQFVRLGQ